MASSELILAHRYTTTVKEKKVCEAPYGAEFGSQAASERSGVLTDLVHELR